MFFFMHFFSIRRVCMTVHICQAQKKKKIETLCKDHRSSPYDFYALYCCVLNGFASYLKDRTFSVEIGRDSSSCASVLNGVPQGSMLGPVLLSLHMLPLYGNFREYHFSYHCCADDSQCYFLLHQNDVSSLQCLFDFLKDDSHWMSANFLQLNEAKSEVLVFGPSASTEMFVSKLG